VVFIVANLATVVASHATRSSGASPSLRLLSVAAILYGSLVLAAVHFYRQDGSLQFRHAYGLVFRWSDLAWGFVVSIVARIAATVVILPLLLLAPDAVGTNIPSGDELEGVWVLVALSVAAVVLAPIVEELYFRGFVQRSLETRWSIAVAIAMASVLFGLAHVGFQPGVGSIGIALSTGTAGAVFGIAAWYTRRLGVSMAAHAMFNAVAVAAVLASR